MKFEKDTSGIKRYIAFDIHKEYALVGGQNAQQEWVLQPRRIGIEKLREWAKANLCKGDAVVIETTTNVWDVYDIVERLVSYTLHGHKLRLFTLRKAQFVTGGIIGGGGARRRSETDRGGAGEDRQERH